MLTRCVCWLECYGPGEISLAHSAFEQLLQHDPNNLSALVNLGVLLRDLGEYPESLRRFHAALAIAPGSAELHVHLGDLAAAGKDWPAAVAAYETALAIDPRSATAQLHLGSACQTQGLHDEAIGHYRNALAIQPDLTSATTISAPRWRSLAVATRPPSVFARRWLSTRNLPTPA